MQTSQKWWKAVPKRRKTSLKATIKREKREGEAWVKKASDGKVRGQREEPLLQDGGRDSNLIPYAFFADRLVSADNNGFDDNPDDVEYAEVPDERAWYCIGDNEAPETPEDFDFE